MATSPPLWLLLLNIISEMVHSTEQKHAPSKNSGTSTLMSLISRYISVESGDSSCIKLFMSAFLLTSLSSPQFNGFPNVSHEEQSLRLNGLCPESAAQDEKNIAAISTVFMINIWFFLNPKGYHIKEWISRLGHGVWVVEQLLPSFLLTIQLQQKLQMVKMDHVFFMFHSFHGFFFILHFSLWSMIPFPLASKILSTLRRTADFSVPTWHL